MRYPTLSLGTFLIAASMMGQTANAECAALPQYEQCAMQSNTYLELCPKTPVQDWACLCQRTKDKAQCSDQCPTDERIRGLRASLLAEAATYCAQAPNVTKTLIPMITPAANPAPASASASASAPAPNQPPASAPIAKSPQTSDGSMSGVPLVGMLSAVVLCLY